MKTFMMPAVDVEIGTFGIAWLKSTSRLRISKITLAMAVVFCLHVLCLQQFIAIAQGGAACTPAGADAMLNWMLAGIGSFAALTVLKNVRA